VQIGSGNKMQETAPYSHALHPELNLGAANVRNLRSDGLTTAGDKNTRIPPWNPIPGVGGDTVQRCVFEAYQDSVRSRAARAPPGAGASQQSQGPGPSALARGPARARVLPGRRLTRTDVCTQTNKFRDTRRFARMNNPTIPRGAALNIITGEIAEASPLPAPPPPYCCPYPCPYCTLPPPACPAPSLLLPLPVSPLYTPSPCPPRPLSRPSLPGAAGRRRRSALPAFPPCAPSGRGGAGSAPQSAHKAPQSAAPLNRFTHRYGCRRVSRSTRARPLARTSGRSDSCGRPTALFSGGGAAVGRGQ